MNGMQTLELVERYGGLAILIVILLWFMRRTDARDKLVQDAFAELAKAVNSFGSIERQNSEDHKKIAEVLNRIDRHTSKEAGS